MNDMKTKQNLLSALRDYVTTLFDSPQQVQNLRGAFPTMVDADTYDLIESWICEDSSEHSEEEPAGDRNPAHAVPLAQTRASLDQFHRTVSVWQTSLMWNAQKKLPRLGNVPLLFGSIWTISAPDRLTELDIGVDRNLPMVVLGETVDDQNADSPLVLQVFPLSIWREFAAETDLVVAEAPLSQPMMIEVWNEQPLVCKQLLRCLGALCTEDLHRLAALACEVRAGKTEREVRQIRAAGRGTPLGENDDPRRIFQQVELLRTMPIRVPALACMETGSGLILLESPSRPQSRLIAPVITIWNRKWWEEQGMLRAARTESHDGLKKPVLQREQTLTIPSMDLSLVLKEEMDGQHLNLTVMDESGSPSDLLNGAKICSAAGSDVKVVFRCVAVVPIREVLDGILLIAKDGQMIPME